ncbi:hypothetical protein [Clostridium weizhouense]|uniref:Uncharacterized protein n=1 Tax=Clostridium weizhouense TaxID=2859781 RepID=A0ABS7APM4_9CLOT|nr:hypothetical protein [Clostridium weizhouense]MBW6410053.1 hypothetical protein [Clostridium weizhouense]
MDIKIYDKTINNTLSSSKKISRNNVNIFKKEFNKALLEENNKKVPNIKGLNKNINAPQNICKKLSIKNDVIKNYGKNNELIVKNIKDMERILDIKIIGNEDKYFKEDNKIDIFKIIDNYGSNVSSNELEDFQRTVTTLWEEGMITDEDYFYAIKWIALKVEQKSIKIKLENVKKKTEDYIYYKYFNKQKVKNIFK